MTGLRSVVQRPTNVCWEGGTVVRLSEVWEMLHVKEISSAATTTVHCFTIMENITTTAVQV